MPSWLRDHDWSLGDVLALAGVVVTLVVAVVGPLRRRLVRIFRAVRLRVGRPEARYASWFVSTWGVYDNPYLADVENLDLSTTYISLSFRGPDDEQETRTVATKVLADRRAGHLIVEGAPGSGKSTLLKAYGVGILKSRRVPWSRRTRRDVPFFVQLRKFARFPDRDASLARYIVDEVLVSGAGMTRDDAEEFLQYTLSEGRAVVMLDGLDEVTAERYRAVLEAVAAFVADRNPERPTYLARIIVTCRRQNFLAIRDEWVPAIAQTVCTLAPLRNSEMFGYLNKLRTKFRAAGGPESFFNAVRASGTLDLHRVPLILAMSVGLYARKDFYEIPNSITKLYQTMVEEMLDRQRFKRDPVGSSLRFQLADKYRFLREFAHDRALSPDGFNEFRPADLLAVAQRLAPSLDAVREPEAFVNEIVERSGLLSEVSAAGGLIFAHRSIHEYLVSEELRLLEDGDQTLLQRANDPEWRQVILFYAAALEQRKADVFLRGLAQYNAALAGQCLSSAKPSDEIAILILDRLRTAEPIHLAALVAASTSPRRTVQDLAVSRLEAQLLATLETVRSAFSGDVDGMLPLLGALAGSNAARIAALVPDIVANIPDDPRLVESLWRCLAAPGIENESASRKIVERLLTIVMDPDGFDELQKQEPYSRDFLTGAIRHQAYPFFNGLDTSSNFVTLLAWAEYLAVAPSESSRYFQAKAAGRLARVEADRRRTVRFSLFWFARVMTIGATIASVGTVSFLVVSDWHFLLRPFGWWTLLLPLGAGVASFGVVILVDSFVDIAGKDGWMYRHFSLEVVVDAEDPGHFIGHRRIVDNVFLEAISAITGPMTFIFATLPLAVMSFPGYLAVSILGSVLLFWGPAMWPFFGRAAQFYLYRPNEYIDIYDNERCRHWLLERPTAA